MLKRRPRASAISSTISLAQHHLSCTAPCTAACADLREERTGGNEAAQVARSGRRPSQALPLCRHAWTPDTAAHPSVLSTGGQNPEMVASVLSATWYAHVHVCTHCNTYAHTATHTLQHTYPMPIRGDPEALRPRKHTSTRTRALMHARTHARAHTQTHTQCGGCRGCGWCGQGRNGQLRDARL